MEHKEFLDLFAPMCQKAQAQNGGFASVRLAQIALESAWAASTPKDMNTRKESFNLTGVKGEGPAGFVECPTAEWDGEKYITVIAKFRAYTSFQQHIMERDNIFLWDNYDGYRAAKTPEEACWALQKAPMPYATDPNYATKLLSIIEQHNLKQYDTVPRETQEHKEEPLPLTESPVRFALADIPADHWAVREWEIAVKHGLIQGFPDGTLRPDGQVTRSEMVVFGVRLAEYIYARVKEAMEIAG